MRRDGSGAIADAQLQGMFGKTTRKRRPEAVNAVRVMMARQSVAGITGALQSLLDRPDSRQTLGTITVPTLVVVGGDDVLTPIEEARAIAVALPATARVLMEIIAGAGHLPCLERPAAMTHALSDFLASLADPD